MLRYGSRLYYCVMCVVVCVCSYTCSILFQCANVLCDRIMQSMCVSVLLSCCVSVVFAYWFTYVFYLLYVCFDSLIVLWLFC